MVKTSDFESENSGSSPGEAASVADLQDILCDADEIMQRALLIVPGPPFNMGADEEYAKLVIDGDNAHLAWPEYTSDYYGGGYLERQSVTFPAALLLMTIDEIKAWKAEHQKRYDAERKAEREQSARTAAARQREMELRALAVLTAKYGKPG